MSNNKLTNINGTGKPLVIIEKSKKYLNDSVEQANTVLANYAKTIPEKNKIQAILLAAGNGSRLKPLTNNIPKVMVEVNGESIIKRALNCLAELELIEEVVIVVGYKSKKVMEHIGNSYKDMKITYVLNKDYAKTNNMYSLWLAKNHVKKDVILLEGDLIFEKKILAPLIDSKYPNLVLVSKYNKNIPGTVITMDEKTDKIKSFIGSINQEKTKNYFMDKYKTINIYLFKKIFWDKYFMPSLKNHIKVHGKNDYYEVALGSIVSSKIEIYAYLIEDINWYEIDNVTDLKQASLIFLEQEQKDCSIPVNHFELIDINKLKQHEEINEAHYTELLTNIQLNGYIIPIIVDKKTLIILDGHHRHAILKSMAFATIPVHFVDYKSKAVEVSSWRINENIKKEDVVAMGMSRNLFPPKTSKHLFSHIKNVKVQLAEIT